MSLRNFKCEVVNSCTKFFIFINPRLTTIECYQNSPAANAFLVTDCGVSNPTSRTARSRHFTLLFQQTVDYVPSQHMQQLATKLLIRSIFNRPTKYMATRVDMPNHLVFYF